MSYVIKQLDRSYNQELLALSKSRTTGSMLFNTDRAPDFFALSEELGSSCYFGIFKENQLIGSVGVARQVRIINGVPEPTLYLFDMKVHPDWTGKSAYYRLVQHMVAHYRDVEKATWLFSTILDTNKHVATLTKGSLLFPKGKLLGRNYHVGFPVFIPQKSNSKEHYVQEVHPEEAWIFYSTHAQHKNFAPADKEGFLRQNGFFLACYNKGKLAAVAKVVEQAHARKIVLTQQQPLSFRIMNMLCRYYKCPLLPTKDGIFHHGYLSYYVSAGDIDYRKSFVNYIRQNHAEQFTYIFTGMTEKEAKGYSGRLLLQFTSSTYGYGNVPQHMTPDAVELTLI